MDNAQYAAAQNAHDTFYTVLKDQYTQLFESNADYAYAKERTTPEELARKMTNSLAAGTADKSGTGIIRTCKALGIKHTYKAIREYLETGKK